MGNLLTNNTNVVIQFYHWFKCYFPLFLDMVLYDNEFETKENKVYTKDEIKPPHLQERY